MVGILTVTGGALATGFGIYRHFTNKARAPKQQPARRSVRQTWRSFKQDSQPHDAPGVTQHKQVELVVQTSATKDALHYGLRTSSISLGLAATGLLFFAPLRYASIPMLIYMGVPPAQDAYEVLLVEGRPSTALAETVVLGVCLAGGFYFIGSLGFGLYYLGRTLYHNWLQVIKSDQDVWQSPQLACLYKDAQEVVVPTATLQRGDQIIVHSSEMVPADGTIIEGAAWLKSAALMHDDLEVLKRVGDRVSTADIVVVGQLCIRVHDA